MTEVVCIYRPNEYKLGSRQLPIRIDDNLTVVVQFDDMCNRCECASNLKSSDYKSFNKRCQLLSNEELALTLQVNSNEIHNKLTKFITCVACRRSVDRLFNQLIEINGTALSPLVINAQLHLAINPEKLRGQNSKFLCSFFQDYGPKLHNLIESIPRTKKSRRCLLHSLDGQRLKPVGGSWLDIWNLMSEDCREKLVVMDVDALHETLITYLKKHRFCTECRAKVIKAYHILVEEVDAKEEKGFLPSVYENVVFCSTKKLVHVVCKTDFICHLMTRAEPELNGNRREKHAKTIEIAQEEVITCIGICLYERFNHVWQKLREVEQTWQILSYLSICCLRENFELAVEEKQGFSQLELVCEEISKAEFVKKQRKEQKRQKKRMRKIKLKSEINANDEFLCNCLENSNNLCCQNHRYASSVHVPSTKSPCKCEAENFLTSDQVSYSGISSLNEPDINSCVDYGYSSGNNESLWSSSSSCDSMDNSYIDNSCHNECNCAWRSRSPANFQNITTTSNSNSSRSKGQQCHSCKTIPKQFNFRNTLFPSLQDMLEDPLSSGEEGGIPIEEVQQFKAQNYQVFQKRQELRKLLRQRFADLQKGKKLNSKPLLLRWPQ